MKMDKLVDYFDEGALIENQIKMEQATKKIKWDVSLVIALVAVLISTVTAFINFQESRIMMEQQQLFSTQQEASVWPFLDNRAYNTYAGDSMVIFRFIIKNKGIGPAIIDSVTYKYDGVVFEQNEFYQVLNKRYSDQVIVDQQQNSSLNKVVLAPGESHTVITEQLKVKHDSVRIDLIVDEINDLYQLEYCYCSVYGKCWSVTGREIVKANGECKFRKNIR